MPTNDTVLAIVEMVRDEVRGLRSDVRDALEGQRSLIEKNASRITALESWKTWLVGIWFALTSVITVAVSIYKLH